jgi:hypothetical protein
MRRQGGSVAVPQGTEVALGGTELGEASRGGAHFGNRRGSPGDGWRTGDGHSRPGVASRGGGGRVAAAWWEAVAWRALAAAVQRVLVQSENN